MRDDDPFADFGDSDRTVIRPSPGGRRGRPTQQNQRVATETAEISPGLPQIQSGQNVLLASAFGLLRMVNQLRNAISHHDVDGLRTNVIRGIRDFESNSLQKGVLQEKVQAARYALCVLIDETVLNTPWGNRSVWSQNSLLIAFHQEAWGGEKFFQILNQLVRQPAANLELLELFYYCLSMGFEGKYRVQNQGAAELERLRENLYMLILRQRGDHEPQLSPRWEGLKDRRNPLIRYVPLWVVAVVALAFSTIAFLGFSWVVDRDSEVVRKQLASIGKEKPPPRINVQSFKPVPQRSLLGDLKVQLEPEIEQGLLEVTENKEGAVIRIRRLFASGQARVKQSSFSLLERVAEVLAGIAKREIVVGHTDSVPIFTARFRSNWALSQARAKAVMNVLKTSAQFGRDIGYEGRADDEPLVANDTPANRAANRRVEIIVR